MQLTRLEKSRTSDVYRNRLAAGEAILRNFLSSRDAKLEQLVPNPVELDGILAEFVNYCQERKIKLWLVRHAVLYVQTQWRSLRYSLPRAWDCLSSWGDMEPGQNRNPAPFKVMLAMAITALSWGLEKNQWFRLLIIFSILLRVGFFATLRTGEMLRIKVSDLCFDATENDTVVIGLRRPKNRKHMGQNQFALLEDAATVQWLKWLVTDMPPEMSLWPSNAAYFRTLFRRVLTRIGLEEKLLTPGSLRPGGVTYAVLGGMEVARLKFRARWKSEASLACYVQETVSQQVWLRIPCQVRARVSDLVLDGSAYLSKCPVTPWRCCRL